MNQQTNKQTNKQKTKKKLSFTHYHYSPFVNVKFSMLRVNTCTILCLIMIHVFQLNISLIKYFILLVNALPNNLSWKIIN